MSVRKSTRTRKTNIKYEEDSTVVKVKDESKDVTLTAESLRPNLRPRQDKNYKVDSFNVTLDGDDNSFDKDYAIKTESESECESSDSELFSKKKRKLNNSHVESSLLSGFENIDPTNEENEYRLQRQKNMQDRFKILSSLDFESDLKELKSVARVIKKPERPKKTVKTPQPQLPRKRSARILNKSLNISLNETNEGSDLPFGSVTTESENNKPRITDENIPFIEDGADDNMIEVLKTLKEEIDLPLEETREFCSSDLEKYCEIVKSCRMRYEPFKIIKQRIVSMDFHPSAKKLIILAGDKIGNIALHDIVKNDVGFEFKAHAYNVNCVSFSTQDHTKFFSTSLEGIVRQGDLNSSQSRMVYEAEDDMHTTWHHEFGDSLLIAEGDGMTKLVDLRSPRNEFVSFKCHSRSVRTVQLHPTNDNYFLTGSGTGEYGIFDIRAPNSKKAKPVVLQDFDKALTSAFFSAKGNYALCTSNDDTIRVFDVSDLQSSVQVTKIKHNNHTGRWLSVFKAKWQPGREDTFCVGSMMSDPKRFQLYNRNGDIIHQFASENMTTYSPVITVHPTLPIFVGGNGSGKLHVFSPYASMDEIYS